jgi:hypothetical protein
MAAPKFIVTPQMYQASKVSDPRDAQKIPINNNIVDGFIRVEAEDIFQQHKP